MERGREEDKERGKGRLGKGGTVRWRREKGKPQTKHHISERKNLKKICGGVSNCNFTKEKLLENACKNAPR